MNEADKEILAETIDALVLALTNNNHYWSDKQRALYEKSVEILQPISDDYTDFDSLALTEFLLPMLYYK